MQTPIMRRFHLQQSMPFCLCSPRAPIRQPCYVTPKQQSSTRTVGNYQSLFVMFKEIQRTFSRPSVKTQSKQKDQLATLKSDCGLFSRLYISCQTRHEDLDEFFSHENHAAPPALSICGKLRVGLKSELLHCLESSHSGDRS